MREAQPTADKRGAFAGEFPDAPITSAAEERVSVATQWQLMWWRFRKHRLAMISGIVIAAFYLVAIAADFLAYADPQKTEAFRSLIAPQPIHFFDEGRFSPHVFGLVGKRDQRTFKRVYVPDPEQKIPLRFFAEGYEYKFLGLFKTNRHLIGVDGGNAEEAIFLLGTDQLGRDLWSRMMIACRLSLTIGLAGVTLSLVLGVLLGGVSGLYGGAIDTLIQRVIEILRSIPTIPLWMGLAAAMPRDWGVVQVYFAITVILSLIGWTDLARVVRGRFLALREEDFVLAAELAGVGQMRIILRHMGTVLPEPYHRGDDPGAAQYDHQRDGAQLPRPGLEAARGELGRAAARRAEYSDGGAIALAALGGAAGW